MAKNKNFPEKERIRWHPKYSRNCPRRLYKASWKTFRGFYPLNSWLSSSSDAPLPPFSQIPKAPLAAPKPKLVTLRWLPRRTNPRLRRKPSLICPRAGVKARCLNHWYKNWRIWVSSKHRAWSNGAPVKEKITQWKVPFETVMFRDFVKHGLALPVLEFFYRLLQFWGI